MTGVGEGTRRVHYLHATIDIDESQARVLDAHVQQLCRRRRTAVHTVWGFVDESAERTAVQLVVGHGVPLAIVPVDLDAPQREPSAAERAERAALLDGVFGRDARPH